MKILVAIDGSHSALRALGYVLKHAGMFGAAPDIILVNVHLPIPSVRAKAVLGADIVEQYYREESEQALAPALSMLRDTPCQVLERRVVGDPASQIVAAAGQHGCDLIVLGTHGHSALGNLFMGSVAMRVIADSPIPVLMVK